MFKLRLIEISYRIKIDKIMLYGVYMLIRYYHDDN
jgi:hypothetical protein